MVSEPFVVSRLEGGLGNQMFQYAVGRRLALTRAVPLKLDLRSYEEPGSRPYDLHRFKITAEIAAAEECEELGRKKPFYRKKTRIRERAFAFEPRVLRLRPPIYLSGWWQSERYFADVAEMIRTELQVIAEPSPQNSNMLQEIETRSNAVAVHVRRGDFLAANYHANLSLAYYREAANKLVIEFPEVHFYLFSDDPDWVEDNLKLPCPSSVVRLNDSAHNYEDMRLMNHCRHFIIANSSFSWWGAWLSNLPGKRVYAPSLWFTDPKMDTGSLIPASWRRI